jgi:hypothetical protein
VLVLRFLMVVAMYKWTPLPSVLLVMVGMSWVGHLGLVVQLNLMVVAMYWWVPLLSVMVVMVVKSWVRHVGAPVGDQQHHTCQHAAAALTGEIGLGILQKNEEVPAAMNGRWKSPARQAARSTFQ